MSRITISEFMFRVQIDMAAWRAATERMQESKSDGFVGDKFERRTPDDWAREFVAYLQYVELEEVVRQQS